jgi:predicted MPP superfamily phosphohydrolase
MTASFIIIATTYAALAARFTRFSPCSTHHYTKPAAFAVPKSELGLENKWRAGIVAAMRNLTLRLPALAGLILLGLLAAAGFTGCRTAKPGQTREGPARFALVSDLHICRATNQEQRLFPLRLARTIEAVNAANVDGVLFAGDLTEHGTAEEYRKFRQVIRQFKAPVLYVPGNHDVGNKNVPGKKPGTSFERTRLYETECGPSYFQRELAGVNILGINSILPGSGQWRERQMWGFLEKRLASPPATNATLLLIHHPPFLKSVDEAGGDYFNLEPYPRLRLLGLARQGGVDAVLSGHLHQGLTNYFGKIPLLTTPPVAFGLPKGKQREGWTLLTVSTKRVTWEFQPLPRVTLPQAEPAKTATSTLRRQPGDR